MSEHTERIEDLGHRLSRLRADLERFDSLGRRLADARAMDDLLAEESDREMAGELVRTLEALGADLEKVELAVCETRPRLYHPRDEHGRHEIDIVAELGGPTCSHSRSRRMLPPIETPRGTWLGCEIDSEKGSCAASYSTPDLGRTSSMTVSSPCRYAPSGDSLLTSGQRGLHRLPTTLFDLMETVESVVATFTREWRNDSRAGVLAGT